MRKRDNKVQGAALAVTRQSVRRRVVPDDRAVFSEDQARQIRAIRAASDNTRRAWASDWSVFLGFCDRAASHWYPDLADPHRQALPASPELLVAFIDFFSPLSDYQKTESVPHEKAVHPKKPATLRRCLTTIGKAHRIYGFPDPTKDELVRDALREFLRGRAHQSQVAPMRWKHVNAFLDLDPETLSSGIKSDVEEVLSGEGQWIRSRALLVTAFNTMARREELVELHVEDIHIDAQSGDGFATIRKSKSDQAGEGQTCYLSPLAAIHIKAWIAYARIEDGPYFVVLVVTVKSGSALLIARGATQNSRHSVPHSRHSVPRWMRPR
jgi:hypothetical protein